MMGLKSTVYLPSCWGRCRWWGWRVQRTYHFVEKDEDDGGEEYRELTILLRKMKMMGLKSTEDLPFCWERWRWWGWRVQRTYHLVEKDVDDGVDEYRKLTILLRKIWWGWREQETYHLVEEYVPVDDEVEEYRTLTTLMRKMYSRWWGEECRKLTILLRNMKMWGWRVQKTYHFVKEDVDDGVEEYRELTILLRKM
jgi:hypothetical protein